MLAPPGRLAPPPMGNPGSAPVYWKTITFYGSLQEMFTDDQTLVVLWINILKNRKYGCIRTFNASPRCIVEFCVALCMHGWLRRGCSDAFRKEGRCYSEKHARPVSSRPGDRSSAQWCSHSHAQTQNVSIKISLNCLRRILILAEKWHAIIRGGFQEKVSGLRLCNEKSWIPCWLHWVGSLDEKYLVL